ncbi:hypothetical protein GGI07_003769 [Coemansia sp. Benny D115]|nr:hypothetical protein GGI07_003769 [Coemansia sp. Benny D115]
MTSRLLARHFQFAPRAVLGRNALSTQLRRSMSLKSSEADNASVSAATSVGDKKHVEQAAADTDEPRVVDASPVYSKHEVNAAEAKMEPSGTRSGIRADFVQDREPVVVHELSYPIQNNKWYRVVPEASEFSTVGNSHVSRVPKLAHGLERVLFSPGVHCLEDPYSGVYNFSPYIRNITQPSDFDYDKLTPYITSSKDRTLMGYARDRKKKFVGSTSSMTHVLSHLYFAISGGKTPDISSMSMAFVDMPTGFTRGMRYPASIALRYHDGVYGIDADKSFDVKDSILSILGKSLEKLLTSSPAEFNRYKKQNSWKVKDIPEENYHYVEFGEFVLRSQLDCRDDRLPRKTFDLKTRGTLAVRMDLQNYEVSKGYQIHTMKGRMQSFEREYYDMVRSAFLKYNFQTRIGNMDGIFVAYHNTARMFGFQYVTRREMDGVLYGNEATGDKAFKSVLIILGKLLQTVSDQYPQRDIRVTFDTIGSDANLDIWVEVIDDEADETAMKYYQENTDVFSKSNYKKIKKARARAAADAGSDPFNTGDPLDMGASANDQEQQGENQPASQEPSDKLSTAEEKDGGLADDAADDASVDPSEYIYVNSAEPIMHYTLHAFSTYNGQDTDGPVTVKNRDEEWHINWKLTKSHKPQEEIALRYKRLRVQQATYFERASPDVPDEELSPMLKILRRISRQNKWRNAMPKGKVVVNHSKPPFVYKSTKAHPNSDVKADKGSEKPIRPRTATKSGHRPRTPSHSKKPAAEDTSSKSRVNVIKRKAKDSKTEAPQAQSSSSSEQQIKSGSSDNID